MTPQTASQTQTIQTRPRRPLIDSLYQTISFPSLQRTQPHKQTSCHVARWLQESNNLPGALQGIYMRGSQ
ncbi:hypothetical protein E2P81_ATG09969 [Venturia nashicola]|uniref:Uncharacterized protein n=1 Tax=Venturia nashicola TaxID=86259 RepID=A0A4Z1NHQ7_9PEZI|nr:hypothetical protein E6O75_ATG10190 [Venturia nashicola]TLD18671.1 hypothetical protein E2P81_ATG09969 [Venturia nashicola]